jgi:hypothetical protein
MKGWKISNYFITGQDLGFRKGVNDRETSGCFCVPSLHGTMTVSVFSKSKLIDPKYHNEAEDTFVLLNEQYLWVFSQLSAPKWPYYGNQKQWRNNLMLVDAKQKDHEQIDGWSLKRRTWRMNERTRSDRKKTDGDLGRVRRAGRGEHHHQHHWFL